MKVNAGRMRFRHQILIFIIAIIVIVMVTMGVLAVPQLFESERRTAFERLQSESNLKSLWILREFEELERGLKSLAEDARLIDEVRFLHQLLPNIASDSPLFIDIKENNRGNDPFDGNKLSLYWQGFDRMTPSFSYLESSFPGSQLYIVRPVDNLVTYSLHRDDLLASSINSNTQSNGGMWRCYIRALKSPNAVVFEDFYTQKGANAKACAATVMVLDGEPLAVVVQEFSIGLFNRIMTTRSGLGETGESYLVGVDKLLRTDSRPYGSGSSFDTFVDSRPVREGLAGFSGTADVVDYRRIKVAAVWQALTIDGIRWSLVAKFDHDEIYAQLYQNMARLLAFWFVYLVILVVIALWFANRIERPLRGLLRNAQRIASGSYSGQLKGSQGAREIVDLVQTFNQMASQIQERTNALDQSRQRAEQATLEAERATQAKSEFLSRMSHELRTPLNGVLGYAQLLRRDVSINSEQRDVLVAIENCGQHLLELINDVLDLSRIESGNLDIDIQAANLAQVVQRVVDVVKPKADEKQIDFHVLIEETHQRIRIDATKFRQILINLLGNAVKFTDTGHVGLKIKLDKSNALLRCSIYDTGIGIEPEQIGRIFQPFGQTATGKEAGGAGLGLSITRQLCEAMGGQLDIETNVGQGTTFTLLIPFEFDSGHEFQPKAYAKANRLNVSSKKLLALIVDDQATNRDILVKLLASYGFETFEASNGKEGVAAWHAHKPHLVLMDLRMPVMDGFDATKAIRLAETTRQSQIIAISASVQPDTLTKARQAGCNHFLPKPLDVTKLVELISAAFDGYLPQRVQHHLAAPKTDNVEALSVAQQIQFCEMLSGLSASAMVGDIRQSLLSIDDIEQLIGESHAYTRTLKRMAEQFAMSEIVDYCIQIEVALGAADSS